ncbi:MAG: glycoside hydrolase family 3 protein, partial [Enterobacteriaceae bacterium]
MYRYWISGPLALALMVVFSCPAAQPQQKVLSYRTLGTIEQQGVIFKDHNRNNRLDPYEDWRLTPAERARDLLSRMTLKEKAGTMLHGSAPSPGDIIGLGSEYDLALIRQMIEQGKVTSFISRLMVSPQVMAEQNNQLQAIAEQSRLGIPLLISIDPRSDYRYGTTEPGLDGHSKWPGTLGISAINDEALTRRYA